jgi:hypothetical protein
MAHATTAHKSKAIALFKQGMTPYRIHADGLLPVSQGHLYRWRNEFRSQQQVIPPASPAPQSPEVRKLGEQLRPSAA